MSTVHSLTTAPIDVYSKTYWTGFIAAVNEEAAYELGLHDKINPNALPKERGWSASEFTPNILRYVDRSTNIDLSSHIVNNYTPKSHSKKAKKEEEEQKYKWLGPIIASIGAFLSAYTWSGYQRCKATYKHTHQVKIDLENKINPDWTPLKPTLKRIVDIKLEVDDIRYKIIFRYFCACAGILAGGGLLTLGAYMKQPSLIPWGEIALVVSAIWTAGSAGLHWQDNTNIRALYGVIALDKDHLAETALSHLHWYYQDRMLLKPEYVQPQEPQYQPFFNIPDGYVPVYQAPIIPNGYNPDPGYPHGPPLEDDLEFPMDI